MSIKQMLQWIVALLFTFTLINTVILFGQLDKMQEDGTVINSAGIVRGGTQRLVKLEILKQSNDELMAKLDGLVVALTQGSEALGLPKATDPTFIGHMKEVAAQWSVLKDAVKSGRQSGDFTELATLSENYFKTTNAAVASAETFAKSKVSRLKAIQVTLLILNVVLLAIILRISRRRISNPLQQLVSSSNAIATGDLTQTLDAQHQDEVGFLSQSLESMTRTLHHIMTEINKVSILVVDNSQKVSHSSMSLSQGAVEQAASVEELSASMEEIAAQTKQSAENAISASELAEATRASALEGHLQMQEMLKAMEAMKASSVSISKIIKVIDEIAFQTNILALNAAVEAARAGDLGKGFAVVAEEVRNLAARSAQAAKETSELIEQSIRQVQNSSTITHATAHSLDTIISQIQDVANLVEHIRIAASEQSSGVEQINMGLSQIADVVQTTSSSAEHTAAISDDLLSQAEMLKVQVAQFKL